MRMPFLKQTMEKNTLPASSHQLHRTRDPLLIPKEEIDIYDSEEFVPDGVDISTEQEENKDINRILQDNYRCPICCDAFSDELQLNNQIELHLKLCKHKDKHKNIIGKVADDRNASCQNVASISESSLPCSLPNVTLLLINTTNNSKGNHATKMAQNYVTFHSSQLMKNISNYSILPVLRTEAVPFNIALSSNQIIAATSVSALPVTNNLASTSLPTNNPKAITEYLTLPSIPSGQCTCSLNTSSLTCDFCLKGPKYICGNCKKAFKTYLSLKKHVTNNHKSAKHFCPECGRGYDRASVLKKHIDRHKGLFTCYLCINSFNEKQELEEHILTHRIKCDKCGKICYSKNDLRLHKLHTTQGCDL